MFTDDDDDFAELEKLRADTKSIKLFPGTKTNKPGPSIQEEADEDIDSANARKKGSSGSLDKGFEFSKENSIGSKGGESDGSAKTSPVHVSQARQKEPLRQAIPPPTQKAYTATSPGKLPAPIKAGNQKAPPPSLAKPIAAAKVNPEMVQASDSLNQDRPVLQEENVSPKPGPVQSKAAVPKKVESSRNVKETESFEHILKMPPTSLSFISEVSKLVDTVSGLREDIDDKRDKLKEYIYRIKLLEDEIRLRDSAKEQRESERLHADRQARLQSEAIVLDSWRKDAEIILKLKLDENINTNFESLEFVFKAVEEAKKNQKAQNQQLQEVMVGINHLLEREFEEEHRWSQQFEEVYTDLMAKAQKYEYQTSDFNGAIARAKKEVASESFHSDIYDQEVIRILREVRDGEPLKKYVYDRAGLDPYEEEESIVRGGEVRNQESASEYYAIGSRSTKGGDRAHSGSRSVRGFAMSARDSGMHTMTQPWSRTPGPGGYTHEDRPSNSSRLNILATSQTLPLEGYQSAEAYLDDIPDNISVASKQSRRDIFKKPISSRRSHLAAEESLKHAKGYESTVAASAVVVPNPKPELLKPGPLKKDGFRSPQGEKAKQKKFWPVVKDLNFDSPDQGAVVQHSAEVDNQEGEMNEEMGDDILSQFDTLPVSRMVKLGKPRTS